MHFPSYNASRAMYIFNGLKAKHDEHNFWKKSTYIKWKEKCYYVTACFLNQMNKNLHLFKLCNA